MSRTLTNRQEYPHFSGHRTFCDIPASASCEDIQGIRPQAKTAHERKIKVVAAGVLHSVFFPPIFIFQSTKVTSLVLCDVHKLT